MPKKTPSPKKKKKQGSKWGYALLGVALLPVMGALICALGWTALGLRGKELSYWPVLAGGVFYVVIQSFFYKPVGLYVFGHELTHALAALASGYRVKSFSVNAKGGEVVLSGTNLLIALAPYCFPIYTLMVIGVFGVAQYYAHFTVSPPWCAFLVGLTFAFHVALTVFALRQHQPDLLYAGPFFSLVLILTVNVLVLTLLLKILFPGLVSLRDFLGYFLQSFIFVLDRVVQGAASLVPPGTWPL